ncbi:type II toxin-antitoxin system RelE/ParE family toxin [Streptosporangium sp. NPDC023615]|uniref:type II toxin-antitoxin system RelE/ParE family toxin n=1 Tax=Streptosporangium sp. NPDC023615 TaxID=3154794 RepID=UPI00342B2182
MVVKVSEQVIRPSLNLERLLKELRPASSRKSEIRVPFAFDPTHRAVLLAAGGKAGNWDQWYGTNAPIAERRPDRPCRGGDPALLRGGSRRTASRGGRLRRR